ncbi:MAG: Sua5/YciO/YrdC/YwlC family protein, partial [Pseudomonadota bacterium]
DQFGGPLVATSANISGEPVLIHNRDVEKRLGHVADAFLHHNRPIERPADDPVYRTIAGKPRPIRGGRGSAPMELTLPFELGQPVLAVGAHMKNVVTLAWKNRAVISPHIGEMDSARSLEVFENTITDLQKLYDVKADIIVCDAHPGYTTTRWANRQNLPLHRVYHHHAHASAAYYECETNEAMIVFAWDGVGYGEDETLWGGETFLGKPGEWWRVASMRPFNLPGGDKAGRQPWRSAAALCWETGQAYDELPEKDLLLRQAWQRKINTPQTTSVGRLFDAAAALTGVRTLASFEGQGPMEFEAVCEKPGKHIKLELEKSNNLLITNWEPLVPAMLDSALSVSARASLFHASLAQAMLQQARSIRDECGADSVSFSGGVFQNRVLTEHALALLSADGFKVHLSELIPVNDAGISFGQVMEYGYR